MSREDKYSKYELDSYEWRKNSESKSSDYCGSCPIETHVAQVRDPKSWVSDYIISTWKAQWDKDHAPSELEALKDRLREYATNLRRTGDFEMCHIAEDLRALIGKESEDESE